MPVSVLVSLAAILVLVRLAAEPGRARPIRLRCRCRYPSRGSDCRRRYPGRPAIATGLRASMLRSAKTCLDDAGASWAGRVATETAPSPDPRARSQHGARTATADRLVLFRRRRRPGRSARPGRARRQRPATGRPRRPRLRRGGGHGCAGRPPWPGEPARGSPLAPSFLACDAALHVLLRGGLLHRPGQGHPAEMSSAASAPPTTTEPIWRSSGTGSRRAGSAFWSARVGGPSVRFFGNHFPDPRGWTAARGGVRLPDTGTPACRPHPARRLLSVERPV